MQRYIPLLGIKGGGIVTTDYGFSRFYEFTPIPVDSHTTNELAMVLERLTTFINGIPGENVYLQFTLNISKIPSYYARKHIECHSSHPVTKMLAERRAQMISTFNWWNCYMVLHVPIDPSAPQREAFEERDTTASRIDSYLREHYRTLTGNELIALGGTEAYNVIIRQMNPLLSEAEVPELTFQDERSFIFRPVEHISLYALPEDRFNTSDYMKDSNGYYEVLYMDNMCAGDIPVFPLVEFVSKIDFPLRITVNIHIPKQAVEAREMEKRSFIANIFAGKRRHSTTMNRQQVEAIRNFFEHISNRGLRICRVGLCIVYWDATLKGLKYKESRIRTVLNASMRNSVFHREVFQRPVAFASSVAGFPTACLRWRWGSAESVSNLIPMLGPMAGTVRHPRIFLSNRWNTATFIDLFESTASKWAFLVIAPTGSGKSFFTNYLVQTMLTYNPKPFVCIVDLASVSSYRPLTELLGGHYVDVSYDGSSGINLFDFRIGYDDPPASTLSFVEELLSDLLSEPDEPGLPKDKLAVLKRAIKRCYDRVLHESPKQIPLEIRNQDSRFAQFETWVDAREFWLDEAERASDPKAKEVAMKNAVHAHRHAMPLLDDLLGTMAMDEAVLATNYDREIASEFRRKLEVLVEGTASALFNRPTSLNFMSSFVCLNLRFMKDSVEHLVPFFLILRRHIFNEAVFLEDEIPERLIRIHGRDYYVQLQRRHKVVIYDEFHNFRFNPKVLRAIDKDARQQRALGMLWGIVTQSLRDVDYESDWLKINLATSAAYTFLLRHSTPDNPREMEVKYVRDKLGLNSKEEEIIRTLVMDPGFFSEIYVIAEGIGKGVTRYMPTPQDYWLMTTHPKERPVRDALINDLYNELKEEVPPL